MPPKSKTALASKSKTALAPKAPITKDKGYTLSTELSKSVIKRKQKLLDEEKNNPVNDEDWHQFFSDYLDDIYKNIDKYLSIIPKSQGGTHLTHAQLDIIKLENGGFDEVFSDTSDQDKLKFNLGIYKSLFEQFKDKINPVFGCHRLNELLSWIGVAVLKLFKDYNGKSPLDIFGFCRKIVVILELSVYSEVFFHYMTGDSSGVKNKLRPILEKKPGYYGIWLRKQEFLGVISRKGKDYSKKYDSGLRIFVRNYIRRLIGYMRTFDEDYPLGYAPVYILKNDVHTYPLGKDGKPQVNPNPPTDYIISREDWDSIPNFLLPEGEAQLSYLKNYKEPTQWRHPPPDWWLKRTKLLLKYEWWKNSDDKDLEINIDRLQGTKELAKWKALNHMLPEYYNSIYDKLWDAQWEEDQNEGNATATMPGGGTKHWELLKLYVNKKRKLKKRKFQIFKDEDIKLSKELCERLKSKLSDYFRLNIVVATTSKDEGYLRDDYYTNNLNSLNNLNNSIIYNSQNNIADLFKHVSNILSKQASARRSSRKPLQITAPGLLEPVINRPIGFPTVGLLEPVIETSSKKNKSRNTGSSAASSADTVKASS
jgi:hypothetical protein